MVAVAPKDYIVSVSAEVIHRTDLKTFGKYESFIVHGKVLKYWNTPLIIHYA